MNKDHARHLDKKFKEPLITHDTRKGEDKQSSKLTFLMSTTGSRTYHNQRQIIFAPSCQSQIMKNQVGILHQYHNQSEIQNVPASAMLSKKMEANYLPFLQLCWVK